MQVCRFEPSYAWYLVLEIRPPNRARSLKPKTENWLQFWRNALFMFFIVLLFLITFLDSRYVNIMYIPITDYVIGMVVFKKYVLGTSSYKYWRKSYNRQNTQKSSCWTFNTKLSKIAHHAMAPEYELHIWDVLGCGKNHMSKSRSSC